MRRAVEDCQAVVPSVTGVISARLAARVAGAEMAMADSTMERKSIRRFIWFLSNTPGSEVLSNATGKPCHWNLNAHHDRHTRALRVMLPLRTAEQPNPPRHPLQSATGVC